MHAPSPACLAADTHARMFPTEAPADVPCPAIVLKPAAPVRKSTLVDPRNDAWLASVVLARACKGAVLVAVAVPPWLRAALVGIQA